MMKLTLLCALALFACVSARTTTRTPTVSAHITSLTDKDARSKAMTHPAFANAGRQAGLEIWRIEDFNPVPVPASDYGKFYKGDSYIVLKTNADKKGNLSWDIHYWIGSESTQDESGAAAILAVGLDDKFNGAAIQHRETMGYESSQFTSYFSPAIRYVDGGHASGFNHVTTNAGATKRLFQIKGKRNIRVRQVDPVIASMNKGDVFILDIDNDIYVFVGEKAKNVEKLKAISVANQIRDQDHNGRGKVEIIDQYSSEADTQKFFTALGSGNRQLVPDESAGGDDQQFERSEEQSVTLSEISDSTGKVKITPLTKPFRQEQLKPQEVYILDTVSGSIYVWVGKQSTDKEKSEAMTRAQQYLTAKKYPSWVHVARIPQGTEPAVFKQYFTTWRDVGMAHSRIVREADDSDSKSADDSLKSSEEDAGEDAAPSIRPGFEYREALWKRTGAEPRLFEARVDDRGQVSFNQLPAFKQSALQLDEIYIIDADKIYEWQGIETTSQQRKRNFGEIYRYGTDKKTEVVQQRYEPESLTDLFDKWDRDFWQKQESERDREIEENEIDVDK